MTHANGPAPTADAIRSIRDRAFARAAGSPLVPGNAVSILKDGAENYAAWLEAIATATRVIHFETYIIHGDEVGLQFAQTLAQQARRGVRVRCLCDWFGSLHVGAGRIWSLLIKAGAEVRWFNPLRIDRPFGWISRDHRKVITIDGRTGFVSGLCVGRAWVGDAQRQVEPWRDIGVAIAGPAVADLDLAFAETWAIAGTSLPPADLRERAAIATEGTVPVRVVAGTPIAAELYRLDQFIAASAQRSLWLTDAYFVGTTAYTQALKAAALDGVDVRLLVPGASDVPVIRSISRAGYRPLLESGIRIFEWNGTMLHAKAAVADSTWARVGSTNLNITSWMGNWELDVAIEDEAFAKAMEAMYLDDLEHSTEVVLTPRQRVHLGATPESPSRRAAHRQGQTRRAAAGVLGVGSAVGAAITNRRALGPAEARVMGSAGMTLLLVTTALFVWPRGFAIPAAVLLGWVALALLARAVKLRFWGSP
ncbi:MAG: phospholipase D-like domain-containing protein [Vicinamibacterales bacterium]